MQFVPLLIQALAVALVVSGPKGPVRFGAIGVQFVIVAAVYHGLTELLQVVFPDANFYRGLLNDDDLNGWLWMVSGSLLIFACAYVASSRLGKTLVKAAASTPIRLGSPWPWVAATVPIYLVAVLGVTDVDSYWAGGLTQQFLLLSMVLTSVAFVQAGTSPVIVIVIQTAAVSLLASRLSVVASAIMLLTALGAAGTRMRYRQILSSGLVVGLVVLTISLARASVGREQLLGGVADRADGIVKGGRLLASGGGGADLIDDFVYRFDGNSFSALLHRQYERGHHPAGIWPIVNDAWVAIPSFLNPLKIESDDTMRNGGTYVIAWFGLSETVPFVPTQLGVLYGSAGPIFFPFILALSGVLAEKLDRRLGRIRQADGLILRVALCQANVFMETGLIVYPLVLRGALVLIVATRLMGAFTKLKPSRKTIAVRAALRPSI